MSITIMYSNPNPKTLVIQSRISSNTIDDTAKLIDKKINAIFTKSLASDILPRNRVFPTNLWMLSANPIMAMLANTSEIETSNEYVPITSVVVILAIKIKKIYPEIIEAISWM